MKNFTWEQIESIEYCGEEECYDISMLAEDFYINEPNFIADGFVVHNSQLHTTYCKRKKGEPYELHPLLKPILEKTYGVMCIHEDTLIGMADGTEIPLKEVVRGNLLHSVNLDTNIVERQECHGCGFTREESGYRLTLQNGFSVILTGDHEVLTECGMKAVSALDVEKDIIAVPCLTPTKGTNIPLAKWLGNNEQVAYLMGQLSGDGCLTSSGTTIASGIFKNHQLLLEWLLNNLQTLNTNPYFHGRSHYIGLSCNQLLNKVNFGNRKTKFIYFQEQHGLRCHAKFKKIPDVIFKSPQSVRCAYLAGLIDSDGCLAVGNRGVQICHITSSSIKILQGIRRLCQIEGLSCSVMDKRVYIWNTNKLKRLIGKYLVVKQFNGHLTNGDSVGCVSKNIVKKQICNSGKSVRKFCEEIGISRKTIYYKCNFVDNNIAVKCGVDTGDLRYYRIKSINKVSKKRFYGVSVANNHNLIANGIVVKNCYQEQIMKIFNVIGGFPLPQCYKIVKAISKKKGEVFQKAKVQFLEECQRRLDYTLEQAEAFFESIAKFSGYAFNLCLSGDSVVKDKLSGNFYRLDELSNILNTSQVMLDSVLDGKIVEDNVAGVSCVGEEELFEVKTDNFITIKCTASHEFLCTDDKKHTLKDILKNNLEIVSTQDI